MESIPEVPSVIFSKEIDHQLSIQRLRQLGASELPTKAQWLLRESSVSGLLSVTFFHAEDHKYYHIRVGYIDDKWVKGPQSRSEAILFSHTVQQAFRDNLPEGSAAKLFELLSNDGFLQAAQVIPNAIEATRTAHYSGYVHFVTGEPVAAVGIVRSSIVEECSQSASSSSASSFINRYSAFP